MSIFFVNIADRFLAICGLITVDALFVVSNKWRNANKASYDTVLRAFVAAKPAINDLIKPSR